MTYAKTSRSPRGHDALLSAQADKVFEALSCSHHRKILVCLFNTQLTSSELAQRTSTPTGSMGRHLLVLETSGLVTSAREGSRIYYRLSSDDLVDTLTRLTLEMCMVAGR
jgi:DNA-binding transcriptional ArsR family regulator